VHEQVGPTVAAAGDPCSAHKRADQPAGAGPRPLLSSSPNVTSRSTPNRTNKKRTLQTHFNFQISPPPPAPPPPHLQTPPRRPPSLPNPKSASRRRPWPDGVRGSGGAAAGDVRRRHGEALRRHGGVRRPLRPRIHPRARQPRQRRQVEPHQ
jgi:hypothetical protein